MSSVSDLARSKGARSEIAKRRRHRFLRGLHNAQNAACASTLARWARSLSEVLQDGVAQFPG